ncbi:MAG: hypothetical protein AAGI10_06050 [Pseudomonadota bacterium]
MNTMFSNRAAFALAASSAALLLSIGASAEQMPPADDKLAKEIPAVYCEALTSAFPGSSCADGALSFPNSNVSLDTFHGSGFTMVDGNVPISVRSYDTYSAWDGVKIVGLSIFDPKTAALAEVGYFHPVDLDELSEDVRDLYFEGLASGEVEFAVSSIAGPNSNSIVAFDQMQGFPAEVASDWFERAQAASVGGGQVGFLANSEWIDSSGASVGIDRSNSEKVISLSPQLDLLLREADG